MWQKILYLNLSLSPFPPIFSLFLHFLGTPCPRANNLCYPAPGKYRVSKKNWVLWIVGLTSRLSPSKKWVWHIQYRLMGSKIFLFILHGSKKIVKNFQTKIQPATWPKYTLKNTKNSKSPKFSLQCTIVWAAVYSQLLIILMKF